MQQQEGGIDLLNFCIAPFNTYFNPKPYSLDTLCSEWIVNQNNPDEILADFTVFMTDGKLLIGYLDSLHDSRGNNYIAMASGNTITNVTVIVSSIYGLYHHIIQQLRSGAKALSFSLNSAYWRLQDPVLDQAYTQGHIRAYKLAYLFQEQSAKYKEYTQDHDKA